MSEYDQIRTFAAKWLDKFNNQTSDFADLVDRHMGDDCAALGFELDSISSFESVYGQAAYDMAELIKIIDNVTDVQLLGSAIYARWHYFNQQVHGGDEILEFKNSAWFIVALSRLSVLTGGEPFIFNGIQISPETSPEITEDYPFMFSGIPKRMKIVSNNICYGPEPKPEDEVEQRLTVNTDGRVWFSAYAYGDEFGEYIKTRSKNYSIDKRAATELLNKVATYFSNEYNEYYVTDCGDWTMELTNTDDKTYEFDGSLCSDIYMDGVGLSDLIRDTLGMPDLYVFNGNKY